MEVNLETFSYTAWSLAQLILAMCVHFKGKFVTIWSNYNLLQILFVSPALLHYMFPNLNNRFKTHDDGPVRERKQNVSHFISVIRALHVSLGIPTCT